MKRGGFLVVGCVAGMILGLAVGRWHWHRVGWLHNEVRNKAILAHADQIGPGNVLVLGDSSVEMTRIVTLCGKPALNAGFAGATIEDLLALAPAIVARSRPSIVVLSIGINDVDRDRPHASIQRDYAALAAIARPAINVGQTGAAGWKPTDVAWLNAVKARAGGRFVQALPREPGMYSDWTHLTARGVQAWKAEIEAACPKGSISGAA